MGGKVIFYNFFREILKIFFYSSDFCLGVNSLDDILNPTYCSILESKSVIDVGC